MAVYDNSAEIGEGGPPRLTSAEREQYFRDGYVVLRGHFPEAVIARLERGFERNPPLHDTLHDLRYPEPGRYTLANQCVKDPDLAFLAEHPDVVGPAAELLGDAPRLTAFVLYNRTPGGPGLPAHNDYKRWRPVGSSMNWLFTIVPFCDFDAEAGPLFVAPGSHHLERVRDEGGRTLEVAPAIRPAEDAFIDPRLERGDLLLMNMHLWHKAAPNRSDHDRNGAFNKYAAAGAPPATGYLVYDEAVHAALSPEGRSLIAVHSDQGLRTTRLVLERASVDGPQIFLTRGEDGRFHLPGGPTWIERAIPDWDHGNVIASLQEHLRESLAIETPWVSYVGDYEEGDGLCRVYGYALNDQGFPIPYRGGEWFSRERVRDAEAELAGGFELRAFDAWLDPSVVRGKGLSQAQCRVDQYAY